MPHIRIRRAPIRHRIEEHQRSSEKRSLNGKTAEPCMKEKPQPKRRKHRTHNSRLFYVDLNRVRGRGRLALWFSMLSLLCVSYRSRSRANSNIVQIQYQNSAHKIKIKNIYISYSYSMGSARRIVFSFILPAFFVHAHTRLSSAKL